MNLPKELLIKIKNLKTPAIIAISGFGGSGKSSLANILGKEINAPVITVDSFQKDGVFDTEYKLWEIMDFNRLEHQVFLPFLDKEPVIKYGHFDPKQKDISEIIEVRNKGKLVVEGVGLFRPEFTKYFSFMIWIDCPIKVAIERGKKRDREEYGSPTDELWEGIWKINDLGYYEEFQPRDNADYIIDGIKMLHKKFP